MTARTPCSSATFSRARRSPGGRSSIWAGKSAEEVSEGHMLTSDNPGAKRDRLARHLQRQQPRRQRPPRQLRHSQKHAICKGPMRARDSLV